MVNFRQTPRPRNYLSRREQWRLLLLVFSLGLVVYLMSEARDPQNWAWLFSLGQRQGGSQGAPAPTTGSQIDTRLQAAPPTDEIPGTFTSPATPPTPGRETGTRYFPGVDPALLESIRDNTKSRFAEREAWFNLLGVLDQTPEAALRRGSTGLVSFRQLFDQSPEYRGRLVTLRGTVRRANRLNCPRNDYNIRHYHQLWLSPDDNPSSPIVIYCLHLPEGFPTGMEVAAKVEVTGFYFKRWAYLAQDTMRVAPVLLSRTVDWQQAPPSSQPPSPQPAVAEGSQPASAAADHSQQPRENETTPPAIGPRDLLQQHGVGQEQLAKLLDGRPIDDSEQDTLLRIMYWLCRFPLEDIQYWARKELDLPALVKDPAASRGEIFSLSGQVTRVEACRPPAQMARRLELQKYYRCQFLLGGQQPAVVYTPIVPTQWRENAELNERAGAWGLFLKLAGQDADHPLPVFLAPRAAWYPHTLLGDLGMDVGLLDSVVDGIGLARARRKDPFDVDQREVDRAAAERGAFYALLAAVGRAKPGELLRQADKDLEHLDQGLKRTDDQGKQCYSVEPLFNRPSQQRGRLVALSGTACRVVRIRVEDQDILSRFGIDHYYEMEVVTDDSQGNPVVFCVRELPQGMPVGAGPDYGEQVRVAGFFFKSWAYRIPQPTETPQADHDRGPPRQLAPLLVGRQPVWYPQAPPGGSTMAGAIAAGLVVVVLVGVWLALWRYSRADKQFHDRTIAKTRLPDADISLDQIDQDASGTPDFSRLAEPGDNDAGEEGS